MRWDRGTDASSMDLRNIATTHLQPRYAAESILDYQLQCTTNRALIHHPATRSSPSVSAPSDSLQATVSTAGTPRCLGTRPANVTAFSPIASGGSASHS